MRACGVNSGGFQPKKNRYIPWTETNSSPLEICHPENNLHLPTIDFQWLCEFHGGSHYIQFQMVLLIYRKNNYQL